MKLSHRITQRDVLPHSCRLQLLRWPDNGGYHAERKLSLYALVDPVSPPPKPIFHLAGQHMGFGGGAGYRPRVRMVYYTGHLSSYPANRHNRYRLDRRGVKVQTSRAVVAAEFVRRKYRGQSVCNGMVTQRKSGDKVAITGFVCPWAHCQGTGRGYAPMLRGKQTGWETPDE